MNERTYVGRRSWTLYHHPSYNHVWHFQHAHLASMVATVMEYVSVATVLSVTQSQENVSVLQDGKGKGVMKVSTVIHS